MSIELVHLCDASFGLQSPHVLGSRMIFEVTSGEFTGERLSGAVKGTANADWATLSPEGIGTLDVRVLVETHDGALVFVQYSGRLDMSAGVAPTPYTAPLFETADERYAWLNKIQAVAKGKIEGQTLTYEIYEVR